MNWKKNTQKTINKMAIVNLYLLITLTDSIQKTEKSLMDFKNKIQQYAAYKKVILALRTHIG